MTHNQVVTGSSPVGPVEVLNTQTSETGGEHMLGNGEPGVPMSTAI